MKKPYTNEDFMKENFTPEEIVQIRREAAEEVAKIRGGARVGAGRKAKTEAERAKTRSMCLNDADYAAYLEMGGVKFIKNAINEYRQRTGTCN
jgi:hypothetical protein